jgi:hypothetical protein
MMRDPKIIQERYRSNMYMILIGLSVLGLILVAIVNFLSHHITIALFEAGISILLLGTMIFAKKKKYLETISNISTGLTAILFIYILTNVGKSDPSPYFGLLGLLSVNAFLTIRKYSFISFAGGALALLLLAVWGGMIDVSMVFFSKFIIVYTLLFFIISRYKKYMDDQVQELYRTADAAYTQGVTAGQRAKESEAAVESVQRQQALLEKKNKELEEQKKELEEMNALMTGREIRMAELKEKIAQLEQDYS